MSQQVPEKLRIEGVNEFWRRPSDAALATGRLLYRPAMLVECAINYRSLRAGLNHSEEHNYTAWLPESEMAIDWDVAAAADFEPSQLTIFPESRIGYRHGNYHTTGADFEEFEAELIDKLVRTRRLRVFFNPVFGLFSAPGDTLAEFLARVAEAALSRVEPELKRLRNKFEMQLEQVREAQAAKGAHAEELDLESFISQKLRFFESESRLADMFSTLAGAVFGTTSAKPSAVEYHWQEAELREDLQRIETEASQALRELYGEYLALANEYDFFEIGLQPDNIQVSRRILLWVPAE